MTYNPQKHYRRSIRMKGYDYSKEGLYFITMCVQKRKNLFGKIVSVVSGPYGRPEMILNDAGIMIERWYNELENKYPDKQCHEMIIMPNHMHFIIENVNNWIQLDGNMGTDGNMETDAHVQPNNEKYGLDNKKYNATIGDVIDWFKTMTTNEYIRSVKQYGWQRFDGKLYQ